MSKPAAMIRALERAEYVRWNNDMQLRRIEIKRIETQNRELIEDYFESIQPYTEKDVQQIRGFYKYMIGLKK